MTNAADNNPSNPSAVQETSAGRVKLLKKFFKQQKKILKLRFLLAERKTRSAKNKPGKQPSKKTAKLYKKFDKKQIKIDTISRQLREYYGISASIDVDIGFCARSRSDEE